MNRRKFLRRTVPAAVTLPGLLNGFSFTAMGQSGNSLARLLAGATNTDHVLVLVQLMGGNDGLNMVIPLDVYANYYNSRTNVAIPQSKVFRLDGTDKSGLHPAMTAMQNMFNEGKMNVVQSVGYDDPNFSHFQARDIWMSGDTTTIRANRVKTGWVGRYLKKNFPAIPRNIPTVICPTRWQYRSVMCLHLICRETFIQWVFLLLILKKYIRSIIRFSITLLLLPMQIKN